MSQSAAAKIYAKIYINQNIYKSKSFIQKWIQRYIETKTVDDLPERGIAYLS